MLKCENVKFLPQRNSSKMVESSKSTRTKFKRISRNCPLIAPPVLLTVAMWSPRSEQREQSVQFYRATDPMWPQDKTLYMHTHQRHKKKQQNKTQWRLKWCCTLMPEIHVRQQQVHFDMSRAGTSCWD